MINERIEYLVCVYARDGNAVFTFRSEFDRSNFVRESIKRDPFVKYSLASSVFKFPSEKS